jgi:hypothetical protein
MGEAAMASSTEGACHGQAVVQQLLAHAIPDKVHPVPPRAAQELRRTATCSTTLATQHGARIVRLCG